MILLKKVRLINWYGFANVTAPIGFFTLIAGKNGNGKSAMLDAVKYAAYGDTVFNKSSEGKGSRTVSSYTRGLLDATAGTYMRPPEKMPNVYSHIVLEFFDQAEEKNFLLGVVIETNASNNYQTYRYVIDRKSMEEINHTYDKEGILMPYSATELQKQYKLTMLNREQGLPKFMQMTGLKLSINQMPVYLRKLRGIMSYDPEAKIDRFIRESVLEEKNVDFSKLIEAKNNIERLNHTFHAVQEEIEELEHILGEYDTFESESNRLLSDDIKIVYKKKKDLKGSIEELTKKQEEAEKKQKEVNQNLQILDEQLNELDNRLVQARVSLRQMDGARIVEEERRRLAFLKKEKGEWLAKCRELEDFQTKVSEILHSFMEEGQTAEKKEILSSLCGSGYSAAEKESAADGLKRLVEQAYDEKIREIDRLNLAAEELNRKLNIQEKILEDCKKHRSTYDRIPDYVELRNEINREFEQRKIKSRAQFACEYVISLTDETWRDAIEAFLGPRRYSILVEPQYYDIADDVLNRSSHKYAHLFNTKLLMRKELNPEADSVVHMLEIKNEAAKRYFEFQLGRMHAVELQQVRNFENAISKEGRVSVAMDSYFLRLDRIGVYYLGQKIYELNRIRAEKEIRRIREEKQSVFEKRRELQNRKNRLNGDKAFFRSYAYEAPSKYQEVSRLCRDSEDQLKRLEKALKNNREYLELNQLIEQMQNEQRGMKQARGKLEQENSSLGAEIQLCGARRQQKKIELEAEEGRFREYEINAYTVVQKAVEAYEKFLAGGTQGGLLAQETRGRIARRIEQHKKELFTLQAAYNTHYSGGELTVGTEGRELYAARKDRIWMDNLQEIRQELDAQTKRYEDIFKNEFVLNIRKYCEKARDDLKQINGELVKLNFSAKYQFDVHYVKDGTEYAKIIEYARYLEEREQLGSSDGQMTFDMFTSVSDEEGEHLEKELRKIINRIIEKNSEETIARFADYRNYMTYEILVSNQILDRAKLSRQTGFNSGAEVQIPYLLILSSALLMIYNQRVNSTRLVFIDEPFAKMDPGNVKLMLNFMRQQKLQVIFCSPDKTETIGNECEVLLPVLRVRPDSMQLGIVQFHEEKAYENI
ncbi:MAG: AAA family ATPase [Clostridium sp.]|nr:AAA family ATPase [Clostridium sp.]